MENIVTASRQTGLAPVWRGDASLLILGSFPGEASLGSGCYYANPRNQFWLLLGNAMDVELALLGYSERLECLRDHRIALWDVVTSARRTGSLDSNIRSPAFSDLALLMDQLPQLAAVAFNGAKAAQLGAKTALPAHLQVVNLPSSSPANTTARETKQAAWNILGGILKPHNNAL